MTYNEHLPNNFDDDFDAFLANAVIDDANKAEWDVYVEKEEQRFDELLKKYGVPTTVRMTDLDELMRQLVYELNLRKEEYIRNVHDDANAKLQKALETTETAGRDIQTIVTALDWSLQNKMTLGNDIEGSVDFRSRKARQIAQAMYERGIDFDNPWVKFLNEAIVGDAVTQQDVDREMLQAIEDALNLDHKGSLMFQAVEQLEGIAEASKRSGGLLLIDIAKLKQDQDAGGPNLEEAVHALAAQYRVDAAAIREAFDVICDSW